MDRAQTTFFAASQRINDLTGYSGIDSLKREVGELEEQLQAAQAALHEARVAYKGAVSSRSATQREVTTLLARQKTWTPPDFERFTQLYRSDYELEAAVADTAAALEEAERRAEQLGRDLSARILARYHEEQIWSDKIRRMSTWGTWGLMGVNVLLFLVFQLAPSPGAAAALSAASSRRFARPSRRSVRRTAPCALKRTRSAGPASPPLASPSRPPWRRIRAR